MGSTYRRSPKGCGFPNILSVRLADGRLDEEFEFSSLNNTPELPCVSELHARTCQGVTSSPDLSDAVTPRETAQTGARTAPRGPANEPIPLRLELVGWPFPPCTEWG